MDANPPRHVDAPRQDIRTRAPKPAPAAAPAFPALLSNGGDAISTLYAAPFESDGVLGRQLPLQTTETDIEDPAVANIAAPTSEPQAIHASNRTEQPSPTQPPQLSTLSPKQPPAPARAASGPAQDEPVAPRAAGSIATAAPNWRRETGSIERSSPAVTTTRVTPNRGGANPISVAIHAMEQSCVVYARAGRMSATERDNLRHSVRALLAEYGLSTEEVWIDGADAVAGVGANRWPR